MREFDLVSIDWETVRLMQAGQFTHETYYLEELVRWVLQRGRIFGILHLEDDGIGRPSPEGNNMHSLAVRGCFGVAEQGSIIEIPDDRSLAVTGMIEARSATVPLYVGVSLTERNAEPELSPSVDTGLLQCGGRRRKYAISEDNSDDSMDWLQVAQFVKTPNGNLGPDPEYIPECMYLTSHAMLYGIREEIRGLAAQSLEALVANSTNAVNAVQVFATAAALAGSLGPAARNVDGRMHPRAYVDRLAGVFAAQYAQLRALPNPNLAIWTETISQLRETLDYLDRDWTLGQALIMARECFDRILKLYPPLLGKLAHIETRQPTIVGEMQDVVRATGPVGSTNTGLARSGQEAALPPPSDPNKRGFWRK